MAPNTSVLTQHSPHVPHLSVSAIWYGVAVLACLLGMATKEVMVTAPLLVLLYDRCFLAGSFAQAWRRRWGLYLGLAATWVLLAYLVSSTGLIVRQSEIQAPDAWSYARTQPGVILHYLRLSVWPAPLCLVEAWPVANTLGEILPGLAVMGLLLAATVWGLRARKAWGFLGAWFLLILAPTSSMMPLGQLAFEHRMYLSLAAVAVLATAGGYALWDQLLPRRAMFGRGAKLADWAAPLAALAAALLALGSATVARNSDYQSLLAIWQDAVDKRPVSPVAHNNLGAALAGLGRLDEAIEQYHQALQLKPDHASAHNNLGNALVDVGRVHEAIGHYTEAVRLEPNDAEAHNNLALALAGIGRRDEAIEHYRQALRCRPDYVAAHNNLGAALAGIGRTDEAIEHYRRALQSKGDDAVAHNNLAAALAGMGNTQEAIGHYQLALRLKPESAEVRNNLANALSSAGRKREAIEHYREALRRKPDYAEAHNNLALALAGIGETDEAIAHYEQALKLTPNYLQAHYNLGNTLAGMGRPAAAIAHYRQALQLAESAGETALVEKIRARLERLQ